MLWLLLFYKLLVEPPLATYVGRASKCRLCNIYKSRDQKAESWSSWSRSTPTKARLVRTLMFLVAVYGSETWTVRGKECRNVQVFEMYCLKSMLRISLLDIIACIYLIEPWHWYKQISAYYYCYEYYYIIIPILIVIKLRPDITVASCVSSWMRS